MRTISTRIPVILVSLFAGLLHGQSQQVAVITSSYPVTVPTIAGINFTASNLTVSYPVGLTPSSYISSTQLNTDFQGFISAYPNPSDPPEAILASVLQSILAKYPQMAGGALGGEIAGTYMGIPIPSGGGSVSVTIGNYNTGLLGVLSRSGASQNGDKPPANRSAQAR